MHNSSTDGTTITGTIQELVPGRSITLDGETFTLASVVDIEPGIQVGQRAQIVMDDAGVVTSVSAVAKDDPTNPVTDTPETAEDPPARDDSAHHTISPTAAEPEGVRDSASEDATGHAAQGIPAKSLSGSEAPSTTAEAPEISPDGSSPDSVSELEPDATAEEGIRPTEDDTGTDTRDSVDIGADHTIITGEVEGIAPGEAITIAGDVYPLHAAANIEPDIQVGSQARVIVDNAGIVTSVTSVEDREVTIGLPEHITTVPDFEPEPESETSASLAVAEPLPASGTTVSEPAVEPEPEETKQPPPPAVPPSPPTTTASKPEPESEPEDAAEMTLIEHLEELRERLIKSVIALVVSTVFSLIFAKKVLEAFTALIPEGSLIIALKPTETYVVYFKVALMCGLAFAMPVIIYQFFAFIVPGLTRQERRWLYLVAPGAGFLFVLGLLFAYLVILPFGIPILQKFLSDLVAPQWRLDYYVSFVVRFLIITGIIFQTPLVIFFLSKLGIVTQERLARSRRYAIVVAAATAAVLTPTTDPFTMLLVMGPMLLLYEVGILLARFF